MESNFDSSFESFEEALEGSEELLKGVYSYGFEKPSSIQKRLIWPIVQGYDCIVRANSGTGKTSSYIISCLKLLNFESPSCQIVILVPIRELVPQIQHMLVAIGSFLPSFKALGFVGGVNFKDNVRSLQEDGAQIIISTPGRLFDLTSRNLVSYESLRYLVVDDIDEMISRGYQVSELITLLRQKSQKTVQMSVFMNYASNQEIEFAQSITVNPVTLNFDMQGHFIPTESTAYVLK